MRAKSLDEIRSYDRKDIASIIYMDIKNNNWSIVGEGDRDSVNKIFKKGGGEIG